MNIPKVMDYLRLLGLKPELVYLKHRSSPYSEIIFTVNFKVHWYYAFLAILAMKEDFVILESTTQNIRTVRIIEGKVWDKIREETEKKLKPIG